MNIPKDFPTSEEISAAKFKREQERKEKEAKEGAERNARLIRFRDAGVRLAEMVLPWVKRYMEEDLENPRPWDLGTFCKRYNPQGELGLVARYTVLCWKDDGNGMTESLVLSHLEPQEEGARETFLFTLEKVLREKGFRTERVSNRETLLWCIS